MEKFDVVIVGNGVLGTSLAHLLSSVKGTKIALVGKPNRHESASLAAAAMLNVFGEVDENTFISDDSAYRFQMAVDATYMWKWWETTLTSGYSAPLVRFGTHIVQGTPDDSDNMVRIVEALDIYSQTAVQSKTAFLEGYNPRSTRYKESIHLPFEGWVEPEVLFTLLDQSLRNNDVTIIPYPAEVVCPDGVVYTGDGKVIHGQQIVLAAGAHTQTFLDQLELKTPRLFFGTGVSMELAPEKWGNQNEVIRTPVRAGSCGLILVPRANGRVFLGASNRVATSQYGGMNAWSVQHLLSTAREQLNTDILNSRIVTINVGHRPITEDSYPLIGETSLGNIFVMTGTRRDGLHMSPFLAQDMANRLWGFPPLIDHRFLPERKPIADMTVETGKRQAVEAKVRYASSHRTDVSVYEIEKDVENKYDAIGLERGVIPEVLDALYELR